jgi:hypothetical protein
MMMMMLASRNYNKMRLGYNKTTQGGRTKTSSVYYIRIESVGSNKGILFRSYIYHYCAYLGLLSEDWKAI